jgi:hypothetical protein
MIDKLLKSMTLIHKKNVEDNSTNCANVGGECVGMTENIHKYINGNYCKIDPTTNKYKCDGEPHGNFTIPGTNKKINDLLSCTCNGNGICNPDAEDSCICNTDIPNRVSSNNCIPAADSFYGMINGDHTCVNGEYALKYGFLNKNGEVKDPRFAMGPYKSLTECNTNHKFRGAGWTTNNGMDDTTYKTKCKYNAYGDPSGQPTSDACTMDDVHAGITFGMPSEPNTCPNGMYRTGQYNYYWLDRWVACSPYIQQNNYGRQPGPPG